MLAPRFALARCASLLGLLVLPLALVAVAADEPADVKKPAADKKTSDDKNTPGEKTPDKTHSDAKSPAEVKAPGAEGPQAKRMVRASFLVHAMPPRIWPTTDDKLDLVEFEFYRHSLGDLLKSDFVIYKALEDRSLQDNPLVKRHAAHMEEWLADQIVVEFPGHRELMTVGMASDDPKSAAPIVNAVVSAFMKEVVEKDRTDRMGRLDNLNRKLSAYRSQLRDKQQQLETSKIQRDALSNAGHEQWQIPQFEQLAGEARRAEIQAELQIARAKHKAEGLAETSAEFKAVKSEVELADVDRKFWRAKSESLDQAIDKLEEQRLKHKRFTGDVEAIGRDVDALQAIVDQMSETMTKLVMELDAEPRVSVLNAASAQ